ncbi:MAG: acetylglutamate kinase [Anaerolineae bacterium]
MSTQNLTLIKVGGAELKDGPELAALVGALKRMAAQGPLVVVHGGGPEIAQMQQRLGLAPRFVEGLRVTDEESLYVAEMVLSGVVNKRLVARLVVQGVRAMGLSGVDAGLLRAERLCCAAGDLGCVGEIQQVDADCLRELLACGYMPVISPISLGPDGRPLNVNADQAALAVAGALQVREVVFLTDVPGVLRDGAVLETLSAPEAARQIDGGGITGGMIPKVRSALRALEAGVRYSRITNLAGLAAGTGTRLSA